MKLVHLPNGFTYTLIPKKNSQVVSMVVLVNVGSRFEPIKKLGMTHLLEHLLFRGSKKYKKESEISELFDTLGAKFNAFADKDLTGYHIKVDSEKYKQALEILADIVISPLLKSEHIKKEKEIVVSELFQRDDDPNQKTLFDFTDLIFKGHPLKNNVGGSRKSVSNVTRKDLIDFHKKYFVPNNMILAVSGNFKLVEINSQISRLFGKLKANSIDYPSVKPLAHTLVKPLAHGPIFKHNKQKLNQNHIAIGFQTFGIDNPKIFTLELMTKILGGMSSSRLFQAVRENKGLVYQISAKEKQFGEAGYLIIEFSSLPKNTNKALKLVVSELRKLKKNPIKKSELDKAKENITSVARLRQENTLKVAGFYGIQILYGLKPISFEDYIKKIKKITAKDIQNLANELITKENTVVVVTGSNSIKVDCDF